ncbi:Fic family protein [Cytobacillus horneckiae]|uniref:Fic family protein n=1 Tax=Cytobacillus horneckiae TaxID=549687 RepID=UPI0039A37EFA
MRYYTTYEALEILEDEGITSNAVVLRRYLSNGMIPGAYRKSRKEGWVIPEDGLRDFIIGKVGEDNMLTHFVKRSFTLEKESLPQDYLEDVLVRIAHHSSAIEGNNISLPDTVSILLFNMVPSQVRLCELYEVDNHREAFDYVINQIQNEQPLTINTIKDVHHLLTNKLQHDRGQFKTSQNAIKGANFMTAMPEDTPYLMGQWVGNLNYQLDQASDREEIMKIIGDFHIQFERIHPFSDGNGRTGRLVLNYSLFQNGIPPLIIEAKDKAIYFNILANQDIDKFLSFAMPLIKAEDDRLNRFANKKLAQNPEIMPKKSIENTIIGPKRE